MTGVQTCALRSTIEDIIGNVEVIIFPRQYEKYHSIIVEEAKIFIRGRATVEEDKPAKMICQDILAFDDVSKEVWVRFKNKDLFLKEEENFYKLINDYEGKDQIKIYLEEEKAIKPCPPTKNIDAACEIIDILKENYGESNIQVTSKKI